MAEEGQMIKKTIVGAVLEKAAAQIGTREEGKNSGAKVNEYLASVGLTPGNPWCAAFVFWCIDRTLDKLNITNPVQRTGYCPYLKAWAEMGRCYHDSPQVGDLFLLIGKRVDGVRRAFHTGFVSDVSDDRKLIETIEGNTNIDGSAEGVGVFRRRRQVETRGDVEMRFVRWVDKLPMGANPSEAPQRWLCILPDGGQIELMRRQERLIVPVRAFGEAMGVVVTWDGEHQTVSYDGTLLPTELNNVKGVTYALLREVADAMGWRFTIDSDTRTVRMGG